MREEKRDKADFQIFSDGSGRDNGIGSVAILYKKGNPRKIKSIQAYIGTADKHNTYEAELSGAILTMQLIQNTQKTLGKTVSLYTDNQSIIAALTSHKAATG